MRAYAPGDPVRLVLWKVYARSRALVVRTPERARSPTRKTVAYVVAGPGDEAAAGAARAAMQSGAFGEAWWIGADGCDTDATTREGAEELLARSGNTAPEAGGSGLAAFLARRAGEAGSGGGARTVLFVPARPGPWVARVLEVLRRQPRAAGPHPMSVLLCTDGIVHEPPPRWWRRWLLTAAAPADPAAASQRALAEVARALAAGRAPMSLVDRAIGRVYHHALGRVADAPEAPAVSVSGPPGVPGPPAGSKASAASPAAPGEAA